jgi:replicative DNA helicase
MDNSKSDRKLADNLHDFGLEFQTKCVACLLADRAFLERIFDILNPKYFEREAEEWIVELIKKYFIQYKAAPTLTVFKTEVDALQHEVLKKSVVDQLRTVFQKIEDTDLTYVKDKFLEFARTQSLARAVLQCADLVYDSKNQGEIHTIIDAAMKAGMEKNIGHDYMLDIDVRMSEMARHCVKTGWEIIDDLMSGGLGAGELGFLIGGPGSGKCVGHNTNVEIRYVETGIPITGYSGKEYIIWIKPFEKYDIGLDIGPIYGWQVDNIFSELEKLKKDQPVQENLHKK